MDARALLTTLRARGVEVSADGSRLRFRPRDRVTPTEVAALAEHKAEIVRLLAAESAAHMHADGDRSTATAPPLCWAGAGCTIARAPRHERQAAYEALPRDTARLLLAYGASHGYPPLLLKPGVGIAAGEMRWRAFVTWATADLLALAVGRVRAEAARHYLDAVIEPADQPSASGMTFAALLDGLRDRDAQMYVDNHCRLHYVGRPLAPDDPIRAAISQHHALLVESFTYAPGGRCSAEGCSRLLADDDTRACPDHRRAGRAQRVSNVAADPVAESDPTPRPPLLGWVSDGPGGAMSTKIMTHDDDPALALPPRIRPPDPAIVGETRTHMPVKSDDAVRRLLHLAFRDARTVLDLTYGAGAFWRGPLPPGLVLTTNNIDPTSAADLHLDYRETGLEAGSFDVPIFDPPHTADNGSGGLFHDRYGGTAKGNAALIEDIQGGVREAWRIAKVGVLVKVIDASHGGEWVALSDAVKAAIPMRPYFELRTVRSAPIRDPKHRVQRVPKCNGAVYLVFRKEGHRHVDFDRLFARQERQRIGGAP